MLHSVLLNIVATCFGLSSWPSSGSSRFITDVCSLFFQLNTKQADTRTAYTGKTHRHPEDGQELRPKHVVRATFNTTPCNKFGVVWYISNTVACKMHDTQLRRMNECMAEHCRISKTWEVYSYSSLDFKLSPCVECRIVFFRVISRRLSFQCRRFGTY